VVFFSGIERKLEVGNSSRLFVNVKELFGLLKLLYLTSLKLVKISVKSF